MKLFCVFISLLFIIVSAYDLMDYKRDVFIANLLIQKASEIKYQNRNGLEYLIEIIVYDDKYLMDTMNLMLTIPEFAATDKIYECVLVQRKLQSEITVELFIPIPEVQDKYGNKPDVSLVQLCTYIGLWTSTKIPSHYIKDVSIDGENGVCILLDKDNCVKKYRSFDGIYYQVDVDDIDHRIVKLQEQL
ncbi:uncharacterized protein LOC126836085 isoform X2 [Adelges cooleyi]|uniref:uncharacterized protein LOC126836085 isoform X2 n=1 Tax=Adelges cooleyi TaxID=133065 RepID=UPI00217F779D|nr:uncharacterized protein LOC126836085 isoform X2 [Adelges cooleyi]